MPLDHQQIGILTDAIQRYDFPKKIYDFPNEKEITFTSMRQLETSISENLISGDMILVKNGLSNILYWGYYRTGYRDTRVTNFRTKVGQQQLIYAAKVFQNLSGTGIRIIEGLKLPEFSKLSFISKIRMFLEPKQYVVLDRKLMKLAKTNIVTLFHDMKEYPTSIPCTIRNERIYQSWCDLCKDASKKYFQEQHIFAVDVERGIFHIIENNQHEIAANIIANL